MEAQTTADVTVSAARLQAKLGHMDAVTHAETWDGGVKASVDGHLHHGDVCDLHRMGWVIDGVSMNTHSVYITQP